MKLYVLVHGGATTFISAQLLDIQMKICCKKQRNKQNCVVVVKSKLKTIWRDETTKKKFNIKFNKMVTPLRALAEKIKQQHQQNL